MARIERDYAYVSARVDEAVEEIRANPDNRAKWTDAELADGLAIAYASESGLSKAMPAFFAVAAIRLANQEAEIEQLRAQLVGRDKLLRRAFESGDEAWAVINNDVVWDRWAR